MRNILHLSIFSILLLSAKSSLSQEDNSTPIEVLKGKQKELLQITSRNLDDGLSQTGFIVTRSLGIFRQGLLYSDGNTIISYRNDVRTDIANLFINQNKNLYDAYRSNSSSRYGLSAIFLTNQFRKNRNKKSDYPTRKGTKSSTTAEFNIPNSNYGLLTSVELANKVKRRWFRIEANYNREMYQYYDRNKGELAFQKNKFAEGEISYNYFKGCSKKFFDYWNNSKLIYISRLGWQFKIGLSYKQYIDFFELTPMKNFIHYSQSNSIGQTSQVEQISVAREFDSYKTRDVFQSNIKGVGYIFFKKNTFIGAGFTNKISLIRNNPVVDFSMYLIVPIKYKSRPMTIILKRSFSDVTCELQNLKGLNKNFYTVSFSILNIN